MRNLLDIEKSAQRNIRSGLQYDSLFPPANLLDKVKYRNGNVKDTIKLMQEVVYQYLDDTKLIAPKLKGNSLEEICYNVWKFVYSHCQYRLDEKGIEQLRRPARAWHDRINGIDCDCYSIFISSILTNLDIPHAFRITKYDADWQHVYVIVPKTNGEHYTLDCVAHHFNYEKPFTAKIDYHMTQLNGIPIAVLSGLGNSPDEELYGILTGVDFAEIDRLEGLGITPSSEQELTAMYNHLVRTRDYITKNPKSVIISGGAKAHLDMLNYAIANWNTPNREKALELLEQEEERWNQHNGVSGLYGEDEDEINGLGKIQAPKKFFSKVKAAVKKVGEKVGEVAKKAVKAIVRFNPLTLAVRGGFLLAMKINLLDMAEKLYPAYLTEAEIKAKGISTDKWQKAKNALPKIENIFVKVLQGKADKLKKAITGGRAAKQFKGFGELGEPATIATVVTAVTPLVAAYAAIKKAGLNGSSVSGFDDMDELEGLGADKPAEEGGEVSEGAKQGFIQLIKNWWKKKFGKEEAVAPETISDEDKAPNETATGEGSSDSSASKGEKDNDEKSGGGGFMKIIKANPVPVAIGGAALVTGIVLLVRHAMKKPEKKPQSATALSGYKKKRRKSKTIPPKMKTIILK